MGEGLHWSLSTCTGVCLICLSLPLTRSKRRWFLFLYFFEGCNYRFRGKLEMKSKAPLSFYSSPHTKQLKSSGTPAAFLKRALLAFEGYTPLCRSVSWCVVSPGSNLPCAHRVTLVGRRIPPYQPAKMSFSSEPVSVLGSMARTVKALSGIKVVISRLYNKEV